MRIAAILIIPLALVQVTVSQTPTAQMLAMQTTAVQMLSSQSSVLPIAAALTPATQTLATQTLATQKPVSQKPVSQTLAELKAMLPPIDGWTVAEETEVYDSDNLYDKINGAAPGFFLFNFQELTVLEYHKNGAGDELPPYISIQIYRHDTPTDAFGIYASERPSETRFIATGAEGYQEGAMLNFFVDNLYVKIESPETDDEVVKAVSQIAQELGRKVNDKPVFPAQLRYFPADNKVAHSELYIPSGFLGHEFLSHAFTANYFVSGKKYQLFIIDAGSPEQANATLSRYLQFTRQNLRLREGRLTIKDRFNGDLECQWKGQYIWGLINDSQAPVKADDVLNEVSRNF